MDDGRDVVVGIRDGCLVDPFADERRDGDVRADAVKRAEREVEILAQVAQGEHRRLVPVLELLAERGVVDATVEERGEVLAATR